MTRALFRVTFHARALPSQGAHDVALRPSVPPVVHCPFALIPPDCSAARSRSLGAAHSLASAEVVAVDVRALSANEIAGGVQG